MGLEDGRKGLAFCEEKVIPLVRQISGKYITEAYVVETKSQGNFVTSTDKIMEQELMEGLRALIPASGFVTEESGVKQGEEYTWVIDPIDGTTNFIYGLPYAVSVALVRKDLRNLVLGVVYDPKNETLYYGYKGMGSYLVEKGEKRRLAIPEFPKNEGIAIFGMPYNRAKTEKIFALAQKYYAISSDLKRIGPASLDICAVAAGKAKLYFELDLNLWDIAAGVLILSEAGGQYKQEEDLFICGDPSVVEGL